jgi:hypothetical protein
MLGLLLWDFCETIRRLQLNRNIFRSICAHSFSAATALTVSLIFPAASHAALLLGAFHATSGVTVSLANINFGPNSGPFVIGSQPGDATGGFAPLEGTGGTILNIDSPPYTVNTFVATPGFLTFAGASNITFTLTELLGGVEGSAACSTNAALAQAGQNCTPNAPALSPYNLTNTSATTSVASFNVIGFEVDSLTNTQVAFTGVVSSTFNESFQQLLADVELPGGPGSVTTTASLSFSTAVPEPGTGISLALGAFSIAGLIGFGRRRAKS